MALSHAHGAIQWLSADAVSTTYVVSGLSFQPKAMRFYTVGIQSATDAATQSVNLMRSMGFAVSTTERRVVTSFSQDTPTAANTGTAARNDAVVLTIDGTGVVNGALDLSAIASDGFTLIVDDTAAQNMTVFWDAWGGTDPTVYAVGDFAEPAATGNQTYTVTGFTAGATDQVVMFAGVAQTTALNTAQADTDSNFSIGYTTGPSNNIVVVGASDDASGTMDTRRYSQDGECLAAILPGGGDPDARAKLNAWVTDGFELNWIARGQTGRKTIFLAIKGGGWTAGSYIIDGSTLNSTATVSGLSYAPIGINLVTVSGIFPTAGVGSSSDILGIGSGSSTTSRRAMGAFDEASTANAEIDLEIEYDAVLCYPSASGTPRAVFDIDAMTSDGFRIITDLAGGLNLELQGYLAFGSAAAGGKAFPFCPPMSGFIHMLVR